MEFRISNKALSSLHKIKIFTIEDFSDFILFSFLYNEPQFYYTMNNNLSSKYKFKLYLHIH